MIDAILYDIAFKVSYGTVKSKVKHLVICERSLFHAYLTFLAQKDHMGDWTLVSDKVKISYNDTVINTSIKDMQVEVSNIII